MYQAYGGNPGYDSRKDPAYSTPQTDRSTRSRSISKTPEDPRPRKARSPTRRSRSKIPEEGAKIQQAASDEGRQPSSRTRGESGRARRHPQPATQRDPGEKAGEFDPGTRPRNHSHHSR
ncbi:hypothetical protein ABVK25_010987 [Lepraria finkii]|uniref:Uncharacterized protein n=1 Tax=Lepraria finkii TaxID=1340010 RepID=A0ABR4ATZ4_9LECA